MDEGKQTEVLSRQDRYVSSQERKSLQNSELFCIPLEEAIVFTYSTLYLDDQVVAARRTYFQIWLVCQLCTLLWKPGLAMITYMIATPILYLLPYTLQRATFQECGWQNFRGWVGTCMPVRAYYVLLQHPLWLPSCFWAQFSVLFKALNGLDPGYPRNYLLLYQPTNQDLL